MPRPAAQLDATGLYDKAVRALARRDRSEAELRRLLRPRAAPGADLDAVLARLRDQRYLDDARFARTAAGYHKDVLYHGRARALRDLQARGLDAALAADAVARTYTPANPSSSDPAAGRAAEDALLQAYARKKRLRPPADLRQAANLYRKLRVAGFSAAAAQRGLRAWKLNPDWLETIALNEEATP